MTTLTTPSDFVRGKTVRLTWSDGPTAGRTHEHIFHGDGQVEWHALAQHEGARTHAAAPAERVPYLAADITERVVLVSYRSGAGHTLTVTLNFINQTVTGVASNSDMWTPVAGTFEVVHPAAVAIGGS